MKQHCEPFVDPDQLVDIPVLCFRWAQNQIHSERAFSHGEPDSVYELFVQLRRGTRKPSDTDEPLDVVQHKGDFWALDNQKLTALVMYQSLHRDTLVKASCRICSDHQPGGRGESLEPELELEPSVSSAVVGLLARQGAAGDAGGRGGASAPPVQGQASGSVAMAWHAREPGMRKTFKNWRKGLRHSREEACITLLRIASRGVAAQPSKKKLFVLRPSSLVFVLVDLVVLRIHVRRITARGACSSEVAVDAAPLLLDRVVSIVPSSLSILHPRRTSSRQPP